MADPIPEIFIDSMVGMQSLSGQCARLTLSRQEPHYTEGSQATRVVPVLHLCLPAALLQDFVDTWNRMQGLAAMSTPTKQ